MKQRISNIILLTALSISLSAQPTDAIRAIDQAISHFVGSSGLMAMDTHWSHNQQQWTFKIVQTAEPDKAQPSAELQSLLATFSQHTPEAASSYFHDTTDGQAPFAMLVYERRDNYHGGILGRYEMKDNYNFRILNFRDTAGLTSYGIQWSEEQFADTDGKPLRSTDGIIFKFYGGNWQMQPFRQQNPWEPKDQPARRPVSKSERALYETLVSQVQYLSSLYHQNEQSGNEQNCDAIVYMMKNQIEGYEGKLTSRQYDEVVRLLPNFDRQHARQMRRRMIDKAMAKLSKSVIKTPAAFEYMDRNEGDFIANDDLRLLSLRYQTSGPEQPTTVEVRLSGPVDRDAWPVLVKPVCPNQEAYSTDIEHHQFTLCADFSRHQLLEVSDSRGHRMMLFADSIPTTVNLAEMTLTGSPLNERFLQCQRRLNALRTELKKYVSPFGFNHDFEIMDAEGFRRVSQKAHELQMQFIDENRENMIPAWYIADNYTTMTADELARCLQKGRAYSDHVALQPAQEWYEGLQKRRPGNMFRDVACIDTAGVRHQLSDYIGRGDYVVLNFWATWQILTRSSCKLMKQMAKQHAGKNLRVIGFALDTDRHQWRQYVKARSLEYEHLSSAAPAAGHDQQPWSSPVAREYGIHALPETIVFAPDGRIVCTGLAGEALRAKVNSLPLKRK